MLLPDDLPFRVYGDLDFRSKKCPTEGMEQITFFNRIRREHSDTWGRLAVHVRNEGLKTDGQFSSVARHKIEGMTPGAADILIPARVSFVCELKRRDRTICAWQPGQMEYLAAAHTAGAFACVALGCDAAWEAFQEWLAVLGSP
jgi:hypothetical protein